MNKIFASILIISFILIGKLAFAVSPEKEVKSVKQLAPFTTPSMVDPSLMFTPDARIHTHETLQEPGGILYRRVEYRGKSYYMQLTAPQGTGNDFKILCKNPDAKSEPLIRVGIRVMERSFAFIEGLQVACESDGSQVNNENFRTKLLPAIAVGFSIDDKASPQFLKNFKNKRIIVWPFVGVAADIP